jgi:hypothetical protein
LAEIAFCNDKLKAKLHLAMSENHDHNVFSRNAIPAMLREESVTSVESLRDRLEEWIDGPAVHKFCDEWTA